MIKYFKPLLFILLILCKIPLLYTQEEEKVKIFYAEPSVKVFADIYSGFNQANKTTALEIKRAYIGYNIKLKDGFSSKIILDMP